MNPLSILSKIDSFITAQHQPLASSSIENREVSNLKALSLTITDLLSSINFCGEAGAGILIVSGVTALAWGWAMSWIIFGLLILIGISYSRTLYAYPHRAGVYDVSKDNFKGVLGKIVPEVALASMMNDLAINSPITIVFMGEVLASVFPFLHPWFMRVGLDIFTLVFLRVLHRRGLQESSTVSLVLVAFYVIMSVVSLGFGIFLAMTGHLHTIMVHAPKAVTNSPITMWLLLLAFANYCTAFSGVETINQSTEIFREPRAKNASMSLMRSVVLTGLFIVAIQYLTGVAGIRPSDVETNISMVARAVWGSSFAQTGVLYLGNILWNAAIIVILALASNTSFAAFPQALKRMGEVGIGPRKAKYMGARLVHNFGIDALMWVGILLILYSRGETARLVEMFGFSVFLALTISQASMVLYGLRHKKFGQVLISGTGATATAAVTLVALITKFTSGVGAVFGVLILELIAFQLIHKHYKSVSRKFELGAKDKLSYVQPKQYKRLFVFLVRADNKSVFAAIKQTIEQVKKDEVTTKIMALHVATAPENVIKEKSVLEKDWKEHFSMPLELVADPLRQLDVPMVDYLKKLRKQNSRVEMQVLIPTYRHSLYTRFLHDGNAKMFMPALRKAGINAKIVDTTALVGDVDNTVSVTI